MPAKRDRSSAVEHMDCFFHRKKVAHFQLEWRGANQAVANDALNRQIQMGERPLKLSGHIWQKFQSRTYVFQNGRCFPIVFESKKGFDSIPQWSHAGRIWPSTGVLSDGVPIIVIDRIEEKTSALCHDERLSASPCSEGGNFVSPCYNPGSLDGLAQPVSLKSSN